MDSFSSYGNIYECLPYRCQNINTAADIFGLPVIVENALYSIIEKDLIAAESREDYLKFYESMMKGISTGAVVSRKRRKDGTYGWYSEKYALVYNQDGQAERGVIAY